MLRARSTMRTGSPMSSTNTSPRPPIAPAWTTSDTASGIVMKNRVISGCVTVSGPARARSGAGRSGSRSPTSRARCRSARPRSASATSCRWPNASTIHSQSAFDWPITVFGFDRLVGRDEHEARGAELDRHARRSSASRACCSAPTRAGSPPSAARACRRRRGRRPPACSARRPAASSAGCRTSASTGTPAGSRARRRARARSRTAASRPGRRGSAACSPMRAICRQSSEPIEPPAPVTSTVSSARYPATAVEIDLHLLATEHVLDLHRTDLRGEIDVARDHLVQPGQRLHGDARRARGVDDALARLAGRGRHRDQHLVRMLLAEDARQIRRSCRARGRRARGGSACAGRRRRARSAWSREPGDFSISLTITCAASPAPTTITSRPRATIPFVDGRSRIVRASMREPATNASSSSQSMIADRPRQPDLLARVRRSRRRGCETRHATETPRTARPHVAGRDVAPPAVVEAEEDEDRRAGRRRRSAANARAASRSTAGSAACRSAGGTRGTTRRRSGRRRRRAARCGAG